MELIINLPEQAYEGLKSQGVDWLDAEHILSAVANGIVLPKGHGDLKDGRYIERKVEELENICMHTDSQILELLADIKNAETVVPADKAGAEC